MARPDWMLSPAEIEDAFSSPSLAASPPVEDALSPQELADLREAEKAMAEEPEELSIR